MKNKNNIPPILIAIILLIGVAYTFSLPLSTPKLKPNSVHYGSIVCVEKNGVLVQPCQHNLLTNLGADMVALALNGTAATVTNVTLGNGTTYEYKTDINLPGIIGDSGLSPAAGTYVYRGVGAWNVTKAFTATSGPIGVNMTALYTTTYLFAESNFTTTTLNTNDVINVTWGIFITS